MRGSLGSLGSGALAAALVVLTPGCVGVLSRSDGEGPIPPSASRMTRPVVEVGGGANGLILREHGASRYFRATSGSFAELEVEGPVPDLTGARIVGSGVYSLHGDSLERRELAGTHLGLPRVVARLEGARGFAVLEGGKADGSEDTVALARAGAVLAGPSGGKLETLWEGEALALDLDPTRSAAWIVSRAPLSAIDCVSLEDGRVLARTPLPRELETPSVRLVRSGRGVVVYALDAPIEAALLLSPEAGVARRLVPGQGVEDARGVYDDASLPPLLLPAGRFEEERLTLALPPEPRRHLGRVACLGQGCFAVVRSGHSDGRTILVVGTPASAEAAPERHEYPVPGDWPWQFGSVGWDQGGAFVTCGDRRLLLALHDARIADSHPVGDALRRGTNEVVNSVLVVGEVGATVVVVAALVGGAVAIAPIAIVVAPFVGAYEASKGH